MIRPGSDKHRPGLGFATGSCIRSVLLAGVAAIVSLGHVPAAIGSLDSLVILHTNDTHARLMPFQEVDGSKAGGAAARAALIEKERRAGRTLLLDAGDVFQGTPYFNFFRGVPDYQAMSLMGYDAGALGNHDLDDGPEAWLRARSHAGFEILSANVFVAAESAWAKGEEVPASDRRGARWIGGKRVPEAAPLRYLTRPYVIRDLGEGRTAAFFGLTTSDLTQIVAVGPNAGVAVADPVPIAERLVPELRRQADIVICISHIGLEDDRELARRVPGIDLIIGGHSHTRLERPVLVRNATPNGYYGTVIAQAGYRGQFLGRVVLYFDGDSLAQFAGGLLPVRPADGEDPRVAELLQPYADSIEASMAKPIFRSAARIPSSGLRGGETPLGNFVADVIRDATDADLAIINSGGIRAALPAGDVGVGDVYSTLPFDNRLVVVSMPGWRVRELLDFSARRLGKGGFGQVSGVSFVIRGDRASYIRVSKKALESDRVYRVATVDFLYEGGDGYAIFANAGPAERTGILLREAAVDFLMKYPDYRFRKEARILWEGSSQGLRDLRMK
jgi:5'-nucleotidase/UDP-sugar diphosphatase